MPTVTSPRLRASARAARMLAEPPLAETNNLPPPPRPPRNHRRYLGDGPHLRLGDRGPHAVHLLHLLEHRALHLFDDALERLLLSTQERIEKGGGSHVVPLLAVLEVHVHRLPEHVVEDLEYLLDHEGVFVRQGEGV